MTFTMTFVQIIDILPSIMTPFVFSVQGLVGPSGPTGIPGEPGKDGAKGDMGDAGERGPLVRYTFKAQCVTRLTP